MPPKFMNDFLPELCVKYPDGHYERLGTIEDVHLEPDFSDGMGSYEDITKPSEMSISFRWNANAHTEYLLIYGKMPANNWLKMHGYPMCRKRKSARKKK